MDNINEKDPYQSGYTGEEIDSAIASVANLTEDLGELSGDVSNLETLVGKRILEATGDETDRTEDILTELQTNKVCILGNGTFYTTGIDMPEGTSIIGFGKESKLILDDDEESVYAIKMDTNCTVRDLYIGSSETEVADRDGILWTGSGVSATSPVNSIVSGCYIDGFSRGGITCDKSSSGTINHVTMTDCFITNCTIGINIADNSEFNKFCFVRTYLCGTACINQGGNNLFIGCDFSKCTLGFVIDNTDGTHANNGHGSAIGCIINHTNNNTGNAVVVKKTGHAFAFIGCQIFFGNIVLEDMAGITFSACVFGKDEQISVQQIASGFLNARTLFSDCTFGNMPTTSLSTNTVFSNCYVRGGNGERLESIKPNRNLFPTASDSFTGQKKHYKLELPAGSYYVFFGTLASTDTDGNTCGIEFVDSGGYVISNSGNTALCERGENVYVKLTIN